jgi:DNA-binding beta-propeller fold protein YncE
VVVAAPADAATGTFQRAWGKDVVQTGRPGDTALGDFEICIAAGDCKAGSNASALGGEISTPEGIATDADGFVYVADEGHNRIQKFGPTGDFIRAWGRDVVAEGSPSDTVMDRFEVCVDALNDVCTTGVVGDLGGELNSPIGVAVDPAGNVYVGDRLGHRVHKYDGLGVWDRTWGKDVLVNGAGNTGFERCIAPAVCKTGLNSTALGGELSSPNGVASDGTFIYVADRVNNRIQKFSTAGLFVRAWGKDVVVNGAGNTGFEVCSDALGDVCKIGIASTGLGGELSTPVAIAADASSVYVADTNASEIQKFDTFGAWQRAWGKNVVNDAAGDTGFEVCVAATTCQVGDNSGDLGGELNQPTGIALGAGGVYVSDPYNNRLQEFDPAGRFYAAWGGDVVNGGGSGFELCLVAASCQDGDIGAALGGEMQLPSGLATASGGVLYVSDGSFNRVQKFAVEPPSFPVAPVPPPAATPVAATTKKCKRKKRKRAAAVAKKKKKCKKKKRNK